MRLTWSLLLLLVLAIVGTANGVVEGDSTHEESGERVKLPGLPSFLRKGPRFSKNAVQSVEKNSGMAKVLEQSSTLTKLKAAADKDPTLIAKLANNADAIEKLAKQPDVAQLAKTMKKNGVSLSKANLDDVGAAVEAKKRPLFEKLKLKLKEKLRENEAKVGMVILILLTLVVGSPVLAMLAFRAVKVSNESGD